MEKSKFEKRFDILCWWVIGFSFTYFIGRTLVSVVWGI